MKKLDQKDQELTYGQTKIDQLTHEMAMLKRYQFGRRSEQLDSTQVSLLDESIDGDIAAIEDELAQLRAGGDAPADVAQKPKRTPLPEHLPRTVIHQEPNNTQCACGCSLKRIGKDVAEKLAYVPGVFTVERHVRGKWVCTKCESLVQAPVPAQVIDKGIPNAGWLAQVLVAKYADHLPLYRQGKYLWSRGSGVAAFDAGAMGRFVWRATTTAGRCAARRTADTRCPACRRDADTGAGPWQEETHRAYLWA